MRQVRAKEAVSPSSLTTRVSLDAVPPISYVRNPCVVSPGASSPAGKDGSLTESASLQDACPPSVRRQSRNVLSRPPLKFPTDTSTTTNRLPPSGLTRWSSATASSSNESTLIRAAFSASSSPTRPLSVRGGGFTSYAIGATTRPPVLKRSKANWYAVPPALRVTTRSGNPSLSRTHRSSGEPARWADRCHARSPSTVSWPTTRGSDAPLHEGSGTGTALRAHFWSAVGRWYVTPFTSTTSSWPDSGPLCVSRRSDMAVRGLNTMVPSPWRGAPEPAATSVACASRAPDRSGCPQSSAAFGSPHAAALSRPRDSTAAAPTGTTHPVTSATYRRTEAPPSRVRSRAHLEDQPERVRDAAHQDARDRHLEARAPPAAQREQGLGRPDREVREQGDGEGPGNRRDAAHEEEREDGDHGPHAGADEPGQ